MMVQSFFKGIAIAGLAIGFSFPALADQIDGDWCSTTEVSHFTISGSSIITPAGTQTSGDYRRHTFSYVVPSGDPGAGEKIDMQQLNEEEILVSVDGGEAKMWRRCQVVS